MSYIYLVEDDADLANEIKKALEKWDNQVWICQDFKNVDQEIKNKQLDLIMLDIHLPYYDGFYWCAKLRNITTNPILFLSSASEEMNIIHALSLGGDDFLQKPFSSDLLIAKIMAILRRSQVQFKGEKYKELRLEELSLFYRETELPVSPNEAKMLKHLMKVAPHVLKREELMDYLWESEDFVDENTLSVNVSRLRKKMQEANLPYQIETVRGLGYRLL